ncbi:MAG: tetratricopeptide repeat protein [Anaerolineae bacterium]|nr:tetratricopeptide repeat protein [Anaerolineae bacterium]
MSQDPQNQSVLFLQQGIAAAKAKQNDEARRLLQNAIRLDPANEAAWLWLSSVAKDQNERVFCLRQLLQINPRNEMALKGLAALGVSPQAAAAGPATPKSTIPQPTPEEVSAAQTAVEPILQQIIAQQEFDPYANVAWVHKNKRRAGERAATLLTWTVRIVPVLMVVCVLGVALLALTSGPGGVVFAPTWTPSHTPTNTATPTVGFTPTPSPTPRLTYTPSPTYEPGLPAGDLFSEMTPTPVYPRVDSRPLLEAVVAIDQGEYAAAMPTLSAERALTEGRFEANPYYYEALALIELGDTDRAERILEEGLGRLQELREQERAPEEALLRAGLAVLYAATGDLNDSNREADAALLLDPELRQPYLTLIENALADADYQAANEALSAGLAAHPDDVGLWVLRGQVNLARSQPAAAQYYAAVALYIDPGAEAAYTLQAEADMARGDYGLAVLHLQTYLFFYPGSITGWTLLGDARALEGNTDLAIAAYSRAVNTDELLAEQVPAYLGRAALYVQRHQYAAAFEDYDTVLRIDPADVVARQGRAEVAYRDGRYAEAIDDITVLLRGDIDDRDTRDSLELLQARAILDGANPRNADDYEEALADALDILDGSFPQQLQGAERALAYEYRARVRYAQDDLDGALADIEDALDAQESGARHYWRGVIEEALGNVDAARREYEWVQMWGTVYSYPFLPDAVGRLEDLPEAEAS